MPTASNITKKIHTLMCFPMKKHTTNHMLPKQIKYESNPTSGFHCGEKRQRENTEQQPEFATSKIQTMGNSRGLSSKLFNRQS